MKGFKFFFLLILISTANQILAKPPSGTNWQLVLDEKFDSFNSEIWAEIITKEFSKAPTFVPNEAVNIFKKCVEKYKNTKLEGLSIQLKIEIEFTRKCKPII